MAAKSVKTKISPKDFVHLHNHSHYSLLDGLQKVPEMLERIQSLGMEAVALTDHGTLSGLIEFYKEAKAAGIKPILGMEAYVAPRSHKQKVGKEDANPYHLTIVASNNQGYQNLMKLSTISHLEGYYYKPRLDRELLAKHNQGLIVLSGCINSELGDALRNNQSRQAEAIIKWYRKVFGDRYYLEVQDHGEEWATQAKLNQQILELGKKFKIPVVVTADAHYCLPQDQNAHEVLLCVQTGSLLEEENRLSLKDMHLFVSDPRDIAKRWSDHPEVVTNTKEVADRCDVNIKFDQMLIPKFATPKGLSEQQYLEQLAYQGLGWRYGGKSQTASKKTSVAQIKQLVAKEIIDRLQYELKAIAQMGLAGYFLIVADFINWAKQRGIIIGPGRGSAAGSIVAYVLNITNIDPLNYDLLFERFLNPERISMPDIDIDFQDDRRDEVIKYVIDKYGKNKVAHIVTFGTMAARNAVRDTARVLGVPYAEADRLAKMVPPPVQGRHTPLFRHIEQNADLKREHQENPVSKRVIELAIRLEGTIRSHGVHAAGVVIAPDGITKFTPLEVAQKGVIATQYSMGPIEDLGLLKIDFLGLANLTIIKNALRIISKVYDQEIDIYGIPLDDKQTFELLSRGDTTGVFQLESAGMKRYIRQLKPNRLEDIMAMVALYRPGPMQFIDDYIARKRGRRQVEYLHPKMEAALKDTHGTLVYQEQVMQIAKDMCGFSGGQADTLRKAIGKKIPSLLAKMKKEFVEGGIKHSGVQRRLMERFWKQLEDFAAYCFNRSHAVCYALIAYQTAYLKAHWPAAFMAALMTSDHEDNERIAVEVAECRNMGIDVLPPDVNESFVEFAVMPKSQAIRFGLAAIKNVGVGAAEKILAARERGGFKSIEDFAKRVPLSHVNRKTWESLIKAGAFDQLEDRNRLLFNLDGLVALANKVQKETSAGQVDLFDGNNVTAGQLELADPPAEISERERLSWERQLLGLYLSRHPLEQYRAYLESTTTAMLKVTRDKEGESVTVGGFITAARRITTRNGSPMAFVSLEDLAGSLELIVFPKVFQATEELWQVDRVVIVTGKINTKDREGRTDQEVKILVDDAKELDHSQAANFNPAAAKKPKSHQTAKTDQHQASRMVIQLPSSRDMAKLARMKQLLSHHQGQTEVVVILGNEDSTRIRLPIKVSATDQLRQQLSELFSRDAVVVET
ncbi:DNA polymerase III subunit alpha [Candidatus Microgenomates bacterium]|nr:DNA polymerase III subunit alpha [Candidatus Microgenomates bacterium]